MYSLIIIDDDDEMRESLEKFIPFDDLGLELSAIASNGMEGLRCIESFNPDIVISDISMPLMSGLELLEHLKNRSIKIIFLTAHADFNYARTAISHGIVDYLLKPVLPDDIIQSLKKCINLLDKERAQNLYAPEASEEEGNANPIILKMKRYAEENLGSTSFDNLVSYLGFSEDYLRKLFKSETGISYKQYRDSVRMEKAKELLDANYYKVYEVANIVGYKDLKSFRAVFKEYFGVSPSESSGKFR